MRLLLICLGLLLPGALLFSQQKMQSAELKNEALPVRGIYRYPAFGEGSIVFRNGLISSGRFNYNVSLDEMHFINQAGDTLSVADPLTISFVSLNGSRFYYEKGYLQTIDTAGKVILAFKQLLHFQQQRPAAYGTTQPHEGLRHYSFYDGNGQTFKLGEDEKVTITSTNQYFLGNAYGRFSPASKTAMLDNAGSRKVAVKAFLDAHHINFTNLKDLTELFQYYRQLPEPE